MYSLQQEKESGTSSLSVCRSGGAAGHLQAGALGKGAGEGRGIRKWSPGNTTA